MTLGGACPLGVPCISGEARSFASVGTKEHTVPRCAVFIPEGASGYMFSILRTKSRLTLCHEFC